MRRKASSHVLILSLVGGDTSLRWRPARRIGKADDGPFSPGRWITGIVYTEFAGTLLQLPVSWGESMRRIVFGFAALSCGLALATTAGAQDPSPEERTIFDNCMRTPSSTAEFCRCGVDSYRTHLSQSDFSLIAAVSSGVAAGSANAFDAAATKKGLSSAEKGAALNRIARTAKAAADACDPIVQPTTKQSQ